LPGIKNKIIQTYEECHRVTENGESQKRCSIHEIYSQGEDPWFPCTNEYFYKTKNKTDGLGSWCKKCSIKKAQSNYVNTEEMTAYKHEHYLNNKEKYYNNRNASNLKNPEQKRKREKEWRQNNPVLLAKYNKERELHKKHKITKEQWIACKDYFKNEQGEWCCAYCELPISQHYRLYNGILKLQDLHKEHFDDNGSNEIDNCVPSCQSCNSSKRKFTFEEWYTLNNKRLKPNVYSEERKIKILKWIQEDCKKYITQS
jgi:hypothetical protein